MNNKKNTGFTLIELMIAVAIISILAAVAIPSYQLYTNRTKITEVFSLSVSMKNILHEYYYFNTEMPDATNNVVTDATNGIANASNIISNAAYSKTGNNTSTLAITLNNMGTDIDGSSITIDYQSNNGTLTINCTGGTLEQRYRPSSCRN